MLMLKNRREDLADAKFGVLPRWGLSDGQTGWRTDLLECGQLTVIFPPGWRVVDEPQTASMGQILPVCTYSDQRSGSIVLFTAIRLDREKRRIFVTLKVPVLAGPALWRWPEDETQACNGRHVESGCSRAVMNEPVKDVFEDESEQQCSLFRNAARPRWT
jgi:hypothetical protein